MAWNGGSLFSHDWNGLELRKLVLALMSWLGMVEVGFRLTGLACNRGSRFWPDWNGLEWMKSVLAGQDWFGIDKVDLGLHGMSWNGLSWIRPQRNGFRTNSSHSVKLREAWPIFEKGRKMEKEQVNNEGFPRPGGSLSYLVTNLPIGFLDLC
jgi:hypothetical protein